MGGGRFSTSKPLGIRFSSCCHDKTPDERALREEGWFWLTVWKYGAGKSWQEEQVWLWQWGREAVGQIAFTVRKQKEGRRPVLATLLYLVLSA